MRDDTSTIFTLNARGNVLLEVMKEYSRLSDKEMFREINEARKHTVSLLAQKGIIYSDLKSALVPNTKRLETLFVFDSTRIEASWYGTEVFKRLMPLFNRTSNHSVLGGDLIGKNEMQYLLRDNLAAQINAVREYEYQYSNLFFLVYINNLIQQMLNTFLAGLATYEPFIGTVDLTYSSFLKTYVSIRLPSYFVKHRNVIIQGHTDDLPDTENENTHALPFKDLDFEGRSIASTYYGLFLEYKIECRVFKGLDSDTLFSLNAISNSPNLISDFEIELDEKKLEYLVKDHGESLKKAGFVAPTVEQIITAINERISGNYIFNMILDERFGVAKFNIMLEFSTASKSRYFKLLLALEYMAHERKLRIITMY